MFIFVLMPLLFILDFEEICYFLLAFVAFFIEMAYTFYKNGG